MISYANHAILEKESFIAYCTHFAVLQENAVKVPSLLVRLNISTLIEPLFQAILSVRLFTLPDVAPLLFSGKCSFSLLLVEHVFSMTLVY